MEVRRGDIEIRVWEEGRMVVGENGLEGRWVGEGNEFGEGE